MFLGLRGQGERRREEAREREITLPGLGKMGRGHDDFRVALSRVYL